VIQLCLLPLLAATANDNGRVCSQAERLLAVSVYLFWIIRWGLSSAAEMAPVAPPSLAI